MNHQADHPSSDLLQAYVDGAVPESERRGVETHVSRCATCTHTVQAMRFMDRSLREMPLEIVRPDFTTSVMGRLGIVRRSPLVFRVLEKSAYIFGLLIVLAIMLAAFVLTGIVDWGQLQQTQSEASGLWAEVAAGSSTTIGEITRWLGSFMPFVFGKGAFNIAIFAAGVLGLLAAADRVIERRLTGRSR